jgi:hypothetical protein
MDDPALQRRVVRAFEHFSLELPLDAIVAPARSRSRTRLRTAAAVAVPLVVVLVIGVLLGRQLATPTSVFGSWQPVPSLADPKLAAAARSFCLAEADGGATLLIQDQRGLAAALLFHNGNDMIMCVAFFAANGEMETSTSSATHLTPETTTFGLDSVGRAPSFATNPGMTWLFGHQPANAGGVVLVLEDGTRVTASSSGGWFLAWWPSDQTVASMSALDAHGNAVTVVAPEASAVPGSTPTEMASPSPSPLPNPGGTCSASQFVVGKVMNDGPGFGVWGTSDDFVTLPLRDVGRDCVLHLPATIGVASATGPFQAVRVLNAGTVTALSATSGGNVSIVLGASWPIPWMLAQLQETPPPCAGAISDVSRVEIPLASGSLQIDLGTVWPEVCPDPGSVSLTFVTK